MGYLHLGEFGDSLVLVNSVDNEICSLENDIKGGELRR